MRVRGWTVLMLTTGLSITLAGCGGTQDADSAVSASPVSGPDADPPPPVTPPDPPIEPEPPAADPYVAARALFDQRQRLRDAAGLGESP